MDDPLISSWHPYSLEANTIINFNNKQLYLIELLRLLIGLWLLEQWHLIYPRLPTWHGMLVFKILKSSGISSRVFSLISSFLSNRRLRVWSRIFEFSKFGQASDLWQQQELASELESGQRGTVDWGRKWLVNFNAGKTTCFVWPV